jgi:hypothetical protein
MDLPPPYFENGKRLAIAGLREHYTSSSLDEIPALWRRLAALGTVPGRIGSVDYAVAFLSADGCDYVAGFEVAGVDDLPKHLTRVELAPRRYAVFSHGGNVAMLRHTIDCGRRCVCSRAVRGRIRSAKRSRGHPSMGPRHSRCWAEGVPPIARRRLMQWSSPPWRRAVCCGPTGQ